YAIEDNSANLARFDNFFSRPAGPITADASIVIENMVRTHGITYQRSTDKMILTDVGQASSATDGAVLVVSNFTAAAADNNISAAEQVRIAGPESLLGNPVDVAFDTIGQRLLIAERANNGGRVLAFAEPTMSGDVAPDYVDDFAGAAGIYIEGGTLPFTLQQLSDLFASSNTSGMIGYTSILEDQSLSIERFMSVAADADGIYYNEEQDALYQLNRTDNVINAYSEVKASLAAGETPTLTATSTADFTNGREIAVAGDRMVVAQDAAESNGDQNTLLVYQFSPTAIDLQATINVDINLWGLHADVNTLYAIVDNSNQVAVFDSIFAQPSGTLAADRIIAVDDLVRTHGITYDRDSDLMILTDVGEAASDTDGALIVVNNWTTASEDGNISAAEQFRIAGPTTLLGNPLDVAYDAANELITVAERANGGGRLLLFTVPTASGEVAPIDNQGFAGASAVYQVGSTIDMQPVLVDVVDINGITATIDVFPNPTAQQLNVRILAEQDIIEDAVVEIYNANGQLVQRQEWQGNGSPIDVAALPAANYTLVVKNQDFVYQTQFAKF
ncbi:MAG: T9SS type A sorting domain-containing protein, partial [Bacteroidota bacterium]